MYGTAGGDCVPCCEAQETPLNAPGESAESTWNNANYRELRRALSHDERPERCSVCWHNEDAGIVSNRQQWARDNWDMYADAVTVNEDYSVSNKPQWLELKVSNFCNLKCIMCSTHSSYKRVQDLDIITKYQPDGHETRLLRPEKLFDSISDWNDIWDTVQVLQFTGGEPIINEEHYRLLASIPQHLRKNISLRYASNLSHIKFKQYDLVEIWSEFKSTNIKVSMDGVESVYNYIRQDGDWDTVYSNMQQLSTIDNIDLAIGITVQAHNIIHLPEFYDFWSKDAIDLKFITANILQTPRYLSPAVWQGDYRDLIIQRLRNARNRHPEMERFVTYMNNATNRTYRDYAKMRKYTRDLENRYAQMQPFKDIWRQHMGIKLEGMDTVMGRLL